MESHRLAATSFQNQQSCHWYLITHKSSLFEWEIEIKGLMECFIESIAL